LAGERSRIGDFGKAFLAYAFPRAKSPGKNQEANKKVLKPSLDTGSNPVGAIISFSTGILLSLGAKDIL